MIIRYDTIYGVIYIGRYAVHTMRGKTLEERYRKKTREREKEREIIALQLV